MIKIEELEFEITKRAFALFSYKSKKDFNNRFNEWIDLWCDVAKEFSVEHYQFAVDIGQLIVVRQSLRK